MKTRIAGIPCEVLTTHLLVTKGNYSPTAETPDEFRGIREVEFVVYDRKGYPAAWLEDKLTDKERTRIENELIKESQAEMYVSISCKPYDPPRVPKAFKDLEGTILCKDGDKIALLRDGGFDATNKGYFDLVQPDERFRPVYKEPAENKGETK